jgi:hypothetical protein
VELIGPYRLLRTLGVSDVGSVWAAFDAEGTSVTVAVIDSEHAGDAHWLGRFETGTKALAESGELAVVDADFSPPGPGSPVRGTSGSARVGCSWPRAWAMRSHRA